MGALCREGQPAPRTMQRTLTRLAVAVGCLAPPLWAQESPRFALVAPSAAALAPALGASSGRASSALYQVEWRVGAAGSVAASSTGFVLEPLAAGPTLPLGPTAPQVLAVLPAAGPSAGGQNLRLLGLGFEGAGALAQFQGRAAPLFSISHLEADVTTPPGQNGFGNPLGAVELWAANNVGAGVAAEYRYLPSLVRRSNGQVGAVLQLELEAAPGALFATLLGAPIPGLALPLPPYGGALELLVGLVNLVGLVPAPTGKLDLSLPIPDQPSLAGLVLHLQGFALEPTGGGFTNRISFTLLL